MSDVQTRLGKMEAARLIENAFAAIAAALAEAGVRTFVVAGGETAGAVVQALGVRVLTFGEDIDPGVPWTLAVRYRALLLANRGGPIVAASNLDSAWAAAEELEETARLFFILEGRPHRRLGAEEVEDLQRAFGR